METEKKMAETAISLPWYLDPKMDERFIISKEERPRDDKGKVLIVNGKLHIISHWIYFRVSRKVLQGEYVDLHLKYLIFPW